jgi:hypothetical protein
MLCLMPLPGRPLIENKDKVVLASASSAYKHALQEVLATPAIASRIKNTMAAREVRWAVGRGNAGGREEPQGTCDTCTATYYFLLLGVLVGLPGAATKTH